MIALDASVLVAHLAPHDVHHATATSLLLGAADEPLVMHPLTLAEVLVGPARVGREEQVLRDLRAMGIRTAGPDADEPLRLARLRAATRLRLPDCCVLDLALRHTAVLATFDHALASAARRQGAAVVP